MLFSETFLYVLNFTFVCIILAILPFGKPFLHQFEAITAFLDGKVHEMYITIEFLDMKAGMCPGSDVA